MYEKHKDQFPKRGDQNAKTNGGNADKEHEKTLKH